jgi:hypothetical protein
VRKILLVAIAGLAAGLATLSSGSALGVSTFSAPIYLNNSGAVTEPGVDVSPTGRTFVNGPAGLGGHSKVWTSDAVAGPYVQQSFANPYSKYPGGGDGDIAVSPFAVGPHRVYFLDLWAGSNTIVRSDDDGTTWNAGSPVTTLPLSDRQWIAVGPRDNAGNDTVYVLYALIQPPKQEMIARSDDSGATFTFHNPVAGVPGPAGFTGPLVADDTGFLAFDAEDSNVLSSYASPDKGATWTTTRIADNVFGGIIPGFARDGDTLWATWIDKTTRAVKVASSSDRGATWGAPVVVSTGGTNIFSFVDAKAGKVAVTWYGTSATGDPNTMPATTPWELFYSESVGGGSFTTTAVSSAGIVKRGIICTNGLTCTAGRELGDFLEVAIDNAGKSIISYVDIASIGSVGVVRQN